MAKILIVDDEPNMVDLISAFLQMDQHELETANNGQVAYDKAKAFQPELIVCDVMMPDVDGYTFLAKVREDAELAETPFIFLTGLGEKEHMRQGMDSGADDYLTKPFTYKEISKAVATRLEKHQAMTQKFAEAVQQADQARQEADQKLDQVLYFDEVTNLPNHRRLSEVLPGLLSEFSELAVVAGGFDGFEPLKASRPEALVNALLKNAANRLRQAVNQDLRLFYTGPNSFIALLPIQDGLNLNLQIQKLMAQLNETFKIMQQSFDFTSSFGVARFPEHAFDAKGLIQQAMQARQQAEAAGGNQWQIINSY